MTQFDIHKLREIADEGIARHGLRGYARKLGLDVSTMRSLRDGRDMQISKVTEIVTALSLSLELRPAADVDGAQRNEPQARAGIADRTVPVKFHEDARQAGTAHVEFRPEWLAAQGWDVDALRCVIAPPANGAGCVSPGALCLLDCATHWPDRHAIWAYLDNAALRMSYLSRPAPGVLLISARDPAMPPRHVTGPALDSITPLGRVVWIGAGVAETG